MPSIFFLLPCALVISGVVSQYDTDEIDPVTGALLATCTFYGDNTVDCTGRLRCHPRDIEDRVGMMTLDRVCPKDYGQKSGTWDRDQVIPSSMIRGTGSGRVAQCKFYTLHQVGKFACTGAQGDTWKGEYSGTMNSAFKLGLPLTGYGTSSSSSSYGNNNNNDPYPSRGQSADDDYYGRATTSSYYGNRDDNYRYSTQLSQTPRDNYDGGRYSTGLGYNDRDPTYRDNSVNIRDRDRDNYRGTSFNNDRTPTGQSENEITMCTYSSDGLGVCRDCTERVERRENDREIRTTRHYTCRGAESPATWTATSGLIPNRVPNPYTTKQHVATCLYRDAEKRFECHGGSPYSQCSMSTRANYGSSGTSGSGQGSLSECLTGEKWTGTYRGSIYSN